MFQAKTIMKTDLLTVGKETPIYEAISMMVDNNITGIPVVDDQMHLIGVVTEKDILKSLSELNDSGNDGKVEDFMTENTVSFDESEDLVAICECLVENHFRRVPILTDGKLVGVISRTDIIEPVAQ